MNYDSLQSLWNSPRNAPNPSELAARQSQLLADLRRQRQRQSLFLGAVFAALAAFSVLLFLRFVWPAATPPPFDLQREWSVLPFFALPWVAWLLLLRAHRRQLSQHPAPERSIREGIEALLDDNRARRRRLIFIAALLATSAVVLPLAVQQLQSVGKAGPEIQFPAFVLYPAYVALFILGAVIHLRRSLLPRHRTLQALHQSYSNPSESPPK